MILPILSIIAVAQAAAASVPPPPPEPVKFTRRTFFSPAGEPFRAYDNSNPLVTWFTAADSNGDGKLDLGEFSADFMRYFKVLDRNGDGSIDGVERTYYEEHTAPETGSSMWEGDGDVGDSLPNLTDAYTADGSVAGGFEKRKSKYDDQPPIGAARYDLFGLPEPVAAMDVEIRGRVTRSTAQYVAGLRFQQLDKDSKGYLTLESLPQTYAEQRMGLKR